MAKRTVYRDTKTGRFASKSTWKRSKAQGGDRYKRQRVTPKGKFAPLDHYSKENVAQRIPRGKEVEEETEEITIRINYAKKSSKT
jgi:hypothetical protein